MCETVDSAKNGTNNLGKGFWLFSPSIRLIQSVQIAQWCGQNVKKYRKSLGIDGRAVFEANHQMYD